MEMNKEMLAKVKNVKSEEELLALAKENDVEMTEETAKAYFELMQAQTKTGELSDEELDNVSGGGCHTDDGRMITTTLSGPCSLYRCKLCGAGARGSIYGNCCDGPCCERCQYMSYESGLWLCNHPEKRG